MANLVKLEALQTRMGIYEIRVGWDNDRHQAIQLESLDYKAIQKALRRLLNLIQIDKHRGFL